VLENLIVQIITSAGVSAALSGILLWLTKTWISERLKNGIKNEYDQKLETHKAQLKAHSDVEIEKLKSQLNITATEHQVKFAKLHETRAEVIAETYSRLNELFYKLRAYVNIVEMSGDLPREDRRRLATEAFKKFGEYYETKLIFLPKGTASKLQNINSQLVRTFNEFVFSVEMPSGTGATEKWMEIFQRVGGEISVALGELQDEFRRMLGEEG
jgi:hypothetical protein